MALIGNTAAVGNSTLYTIAVDEHYGYLWYTQNQQGWHGYGRPAVSLKPYLGAAPDTAGAVIAFVLGTDGKLYSVQVGSGGWSPGVAAAVPLTGGVGVVLASGVNAFAIGNDGNLYWWNNQTFQQVGAPAAMLENTGSVGAALNASGDLEVCALGRDGKLYNIWQSAGVWSAWNPIGMPILEIPAKGGGAPTQAAVELVGSVALCNAAAQLQAFAVDTDGNLWSTTGGELTWAAWQFVGSAGGGFVGAGSLGATAAGSGVVVCGSAGDGNSYCATSEGTGWSTWTPLGQPLESTLPSPMYRYSAAQLGGKGSITLGNATPSVDGNSPFTVAAWIRLLARPSGATVISKGNAFTLALASGRQITAQLGTSTPVTVNVGLDPHVWYFLAATYTPSGNGDNTGMLAVYLNGDNVGPAAAQTGVTDSGDSFVLGGQLHAQFASASIWSAALDKTALVPSWTPSSVEGEGLVASYWFTQGAGVDLSGNGNSITLSSSGAAIEWLAPSVVLDGSSYLSPSAMDGTNPGGSAPFSFHAWVAPVAPALPPSIDDKVDVVVFANGTAWATESLVGYLSYDIKAKQFTWTVQQGGVLGTTIAATTTIPPKSWSHLAATYDGATLTLYVNGVAAGSGPMAAIPPIASPRLTIGAVPDTAAANQYSNYFTGAIQALGVWSTCLTAAQVIISMTTDPTSLQVPGCTAFYRLSGTGGLVNTLSGLPIGSYHGAVLFDVDAGSGTLGSAPAKGSAVAVRRRRRRTPAFASSEDAPRETRPVTSLMTDAGFDRMIASYARLVEGLAPEQAARLKDLFEQNLYRGFRLHEAGGSAVPGMLTHERVGDEVVFSFQTADGPVEAARMDASELGECGAWIIEIIGSCVSILASILGVSFGAANLVKTLSKVWNVISEDIRFLIAAAEDAGELAELPIEIAHALHRYGYLTATVAAMLSGYSWWSFAFVLLNVILEIVAIFTTGGWWLAFVVAQLAVSVAELVYIISKKPADCNAGPVVASIAPVQIAAGSAAFTLAVGGAPFKENATVQWNGTPLTTSYVSGKILNASVPAANVATAGTATITVTNPSTAPSNALAFTVT